jgi:REP element-mobilizing transposase RayT
MPRPRKIHVHNMVLLISISVEQGLLLLPNKLCETLIQSALARAQALHPLTVCHFIIEGTHVHLLAVVSNPDDVKGFVERFKTESAHAINRLLGRKKRTIWCEGYDSPTVLTASEVMRYLVYLYTNPAKDNLEDTINRYPGLSSWEMFVNNQHEQEWAWIHRPAFSGISDRALSPKNYSALAGELLAQAKEKHTFRIDPNAWMKCFGINSKEDQDRLNAELKMRILAQEARYHEQRQRDGKTVIGREKLLGQRFDTSYTPERHGRRMWCLSDEKEPRINFITWVKDLIKQAREVYRRWQRGDSSVPFPLGLYPPSMPKVAEPLTAMW